MKDFAILQKQEEIIAQHVWSNRVRFMPELDTESVKKFLNGDQMIDFYKDKCLGVSMRVDIDANGYLTSCKHFKEFYMGDLKNQELMEIWKSDKYNELRKKVHSALMPVCSKCSVLYLQSN